MDTSIESDDIIVADDAGVDPEDTDNVHSDEELDAESDDECPYQDNRWDESEEEDDGYDNILSPEPPRGLDALDELEDSDHGDDMESDLGSPGDARDPQSNEEGREQGEQGEQDGGVDGDANDNSASVQLPREHYERKRDYNEKAYELAAAVMESQNWTKEREDWFILEFFKAEYPPDHWKKLAKILRVEVLCIADDGAAGLARADMMAWPQVPGAMGVLLGIVPRIESTVSAPRRVGGTTVGRVPRVAMASLNGADWKNQVTGTLEVEEWTDEQKEKCGSARVVMIKEKRTRSGSTPNVLQPIEYFETFFDKRMFGLLAGETLRHINTTAMQEENDKPPHYKHSWPPRWASTMSDKVGISRDKCEREIRKFFGVLVGLAVNGNKHSVAEMLSDDWSVEVGWLKDPNLGVTSDWFHAVLHSLRCQSDEWSEEKAKPSEYPGYVLPSDVEAFPDDTYRRKAGEGGQPGGEALTNGELTHNHKVRKVGRILEMFHQNCLTKYTPRSYLSMDEQRVMMAHKTGSYRIHAKNKPIKTGVTIISVCEAKVGYLRTFNVDIGVLDTHEGKKWPYIKQLASYCAGKFYKLVADNWFLSVKFLRWGLENKLYVCGTCMKSVSQTGFPADIMTDGKKHAREEILWRWAAPQLSAIRWQDTGSVHFLANFIDPRDEVKLKRWIKNPGQRSTREDVTAPLVADVYNTNMAGCDQSDQLRASMTVHRKTRKWWHPLGIFWLIDQSLVNAYILYKDECAHFKQKPMSRKKFHKAVAESLLGGYEPAAPPKRRASVGSTSVQQRQRRAPLSQDTTVMCIPVKHKRKGVNCTQCRDSSGTTVKRRRTVFMCKGCNVPLCINEEGKNCWEAYHNPDPREE